MKKESLVERIILAAFVMLPYLSVAQADSLQWSSGFVVKSDGTTSDGKVKFDQMNSVLLFEDESGGNTYTPKSILSFSFFDKATNRNRTFYSLPFSENQNLPPRNFFFELLRDYKTFAILLRFDPMELVNGADMTYTNPNGAPVMKLAETKAFQTETVYFMSENGEIEPYMKLWREFRTEVSQETDYHSKAVLIDKDLFAKYISWKSYNELRRYGRQHNLALRRKDDFIKLLEYCDELMAQHRNSR